MPGHAPLAELVVTYAIALALILVLSRIRIPPIVSFIVAGAVAGPAGIGIVKTQDDVEMLAEMGIVLLLFTVGLEFSLTEIRRIWRKVLIGGTLQVALTALVILVLVVAFFGSVSTWRLGLFAGLFVALSSTAIVLQELGTLNQLDSPHGRLVVGVMLFQDLCIVGLLLLVPILSGMTPLSAVPGVLAKAAAAIGVVAVVSKFVLPILFRLVGRSGRREAFPLAVILASIGTAWASSLLGISMALGAFLGGLVLAESEYSHQAYAEIRPLRDILAGLFFISLGMLVDPGVLLKQFPIVIAIALLLVIVKASVATVAFIAAGTTMRVAATAGLDLAQVGEFSFILGRSGREVGSAQRGVLAAPARRQHRDDGGDASGTRGRATPGIVGWR